MSAEAAIGAALAPGQHARAQRHRGGRRSQSDSVRLEVRVLRGHGAEASAMRRHSRW